MELKDFYVSWYDTQGQEVQLYSNNNLLFQGSWCDIPDDILEYSVDKWYIDFEEQVIIFYLEGGYSRLECDND